MSGLPQFTLLASDAHVAQWVTTARVARRLSKVQLARAAGITPRQLSRIEKCRCKSLNLKTLRKIFSVLNVTMNLILVTTT